MKKKEKKMILILVIASILIIGVIWFVTRPKDNKTASTNVGTTGESSAAQGEYTKVDEEGTVVNTSEKINKDREELGFLLTNVKLEEKNGETIISAKVTNKTDSDQESFFGKIILFDKNGNEIGQIPTMVSDTKKGETIEIEASITESYVNAYDFKLEK